MEKLREAYRILGVPADSPLRVVREAYRRLAKEYHPDSNPNNPTHSTSMMMKINDAYETIKWHTERGVTVEAYRRSERVRYPYEEMIHRWEEERKQEEEKRRREEDRQRRRDEAYYRFWERVALEQKYEIHDRRYYEIITRYTGILISFYYKNNLHNQHYREHPSGNSFFSQYLVRYSLLLSKSRKVEGLCSSQKYKKRSRTVSEFLRLFIEDARSVVPIEAERRAQALSIYQRAVDSADRFLSNCFVVDGFNGEKAKELLSRSLDDFEYFLQSYPQSPLVEHAQRKLAVLEGIYRSFMTD
jgi:curved DNA-binding protein CbpA